MDHRRRREHQGSTGGKCSTADDPCFLDAHAEHQRTAPRRRRTVEVTLKSRQIIQVTTASATPPSARQTKAEHVFASAETHDWTRPGYLRGRRTRNSLFFTPLPAALYRRRFPFPSAKTMSYLGGESGNLVRATVDLTADDPKAPYGGKEAQERRSGGGWLCRNRQNHPYRGPCACARWTPKRDGNGNRRLAQPALLVVSGRLDCWTVVYDNNNTKLPCRWRHGFNGAGRKHNTHRASRGRDARDEEEDGLGRREREHRRQLERAALLLAEPRARDPLDEVLKQCGGLALRDVKCARPFWRRRGVAQRRAVAPRARRGGP